jgi:hypothetical protein
MIRINAEIHAPFRGVEALGGNVFEPFSRPRERFCSLIGSEGTNLFPFRDPHASFSTLSGPSIRASRLRGNSRR